MILMRKNGLSPDLGVVINSYSSLVALYYSHLIFFSGMPANDSSVQEQGESELR